eukprot:4195558-Amphidinium_carterae.2
MARHGSQQENPLCDRIPSEDCFALKALAAPAPTSNWFSALCLHAVGPDLMGSLMGSAIYVQSGGQGRIILLTCSYIESAARYVCHHHPCRHHKNHNHR